MILFIDKHVRGLRKNVYYFYCYSVRVSQFRFKKKFRFKAKLSETQTVSLGFASFSRNSGKKFRFISLQKFCFVSLKNMFCFKVSLREQFRFKSFASFRSTVVSTLSYYACSTIVSTSRYYALFYNSVYITLLCSVLQ